MRGQAFDRVVIVMTATPLDRLGGSSVYLTAFAQTLADAGREVHLICLRPLAGDAACRRIMSDCLAPYDAVWLRRAARIGNFVATFGLRRWAKWIKRLVQGEKISWEPLFTVPTQSEIAWGVARIRRLAPDLVVSNYYTGAALFDQLPADTVTAILLHDVVALKRRSAQAAGVHVGWHSEHEDAEREAFAQADVVLTIKNEEQPYVREAAPQADLLTFPVIARIPPNDLEAPRPPVCLMVGGPTTSNIDGLNWLLRDVWPLVRALRPDARLRAVGGMCDGVTASWPDGAEAAGFVADLAAEHAGAAVGLGPLRFGSGVKVKLVQALSEGLPVVCTNVAAEGFVPAPSNVLRIADLPQAFAEAIVAALNDPQAGETRRAAQAFAAERFSAEIAGGKALADLDRLVARRRSAG